MPQSPPISIIMPCYNAEKSIEKSIESVFRQTFKDFELIVVNDGSTDSSLAKLTALAKTYVNLRVLNQPNKGPGSARNRGIKEAKGEFIAFLDSDDSWDPDCLSKLHQTLQATPDAAIAYCGWQNIGLSPDCCKPFIPPDYETPDKIEPIFTSCRWPIHACLTRKRAILEAGLFDESLLTAEDFFLWLNIAYQNKITRVPEVLSFYHFHDDEQASSNKARAAINHWLAQRKFLQQNPEVFSMLGKTKVRQCMHGVLLKRGFECYWKRDLEAARAIFKKVMLQWYGSVKEWFYMLPSLLPLSFHRLLIKILSR